MHTHYKETKDTDERTKDTNERTKQADRHADTKIETQTSGQEIRQTDKC